MRRHHSAELAIRAITRYRQSQWAGRTHGCCRYTPTCSHYAETALRRRAFPMAVVLIAWRILRCRPRVAPGTYDPVPLSSRRPIGKVSAVLVLSGMVTVGTAAMADAVTPRQVTEGGCTATINGQDIGSFNRNNPLVVTKGETVSVKGFAPAAYANAPGPDHGYTVSRLEVQLVASLSVGPGDKKNGSGSKTFDSSENVDSYLKYGSGLYRISGVARGISPAGGWLCKATFYARLEGNDVPGLVAGAIALAGLGGALTAGGQSDWAAGDSVPEGPTAVGDSTTGADDAPRVDVSPDTGANRRDDVSELGCLAAILGVFGFSDGDLFMGPFAAVPLPLGAGDVTGHRFRRRGHPIRGFLGGLVAGLGGTVFMQQRGYWLLDTQTVVILPLALAVLFGYRGWRGRAFVAVPRSSAPTT